MASKPTLEQLHVLRTYLDACERAAIPPPPPPPPPPLETRGLLGSFLRSSTPPPPTLLGRYAHPETLADVLNPMVPPFESSELLGATRGARVQQLGEWLRRFSAFAWMNRQPTLSAGLETFRRVKSRRSTHAKFSDDLAEMRYWNFAAWAVMLLGASHKPPPDADQRQQAIGAARKLRELDGKTSLLFAANIRYPESEKFLAALRQLEALAALKRRTRNDAFTPDRKYVEGITLIALQIFGDAPPALICEVAGLKVKNPDKVSITKQVSAYKKQQAQPAKV